MPYRVTGSVVDARSGEPLAGLVVRAYDKDLLVDDFLGATNTDAAGRFEIAFTELQFRDFNETRPDLYIGIYDASGERLLHSTEGAPRSNTLLDEHFEIRIAASARAGESSG
jgi:5-hydroxyisourate hydrolase-like protein (transthyretin family)